MLVEKIKEIAANRGFQFDIGNEYWHNLLDAPDDASKEFKDRKVYLLLFNEKESRNYGDFAVKDDTRTAVFLLAVRSKISDKDFKYKYDTHIKPLKELARDIEEKEFSLCDDMVLKSYSIDNWKEDYLDSNLDCVEVRISVEYNG